MRQFTRQVLRPESFGGLFYDTGTRSLRVLTRPEYEAMRSRFQLESPRGNPLQIFDATTEGFPLRTDALSAPINLFVELTRRCPRRCTHCYANASALTQDELTLQELERILTRFRDIGGFTVRLTGGEPTVRPDFLEVLELLQSLEVVCALNTNGDFNEHFLAQIIDWGVRDFRVSLDGIEQTNDTIRWNGAFRSALGTLEALTAYNRSNDSKLSVTINTVLMRSNQQDVRAIIELAAGLGHKVSFGLLRITGRAKASEMLSALELGQVIEVAERACRDLRLKPGTVRMNYISLSGEMPLSGYRPFPFDGSKCPLGTLGIAVDVQGRIVPCGYFVTVRDERFRGDDLCHVDLLFAWHTSSVLNEARRVTRSCCFGCTLYKTRCNGGCPMMAYVASGNLDGRDPYCLRIPSNPIPEV